MRPANEDEKKTRVPRCGDYVHHERSGEDWVVAYADPARDEISWAGWPDGCAKLSGCVLTDVCDDDEHVRAVREWTKDGCYRSGQVERLYPDAWAKAKALPDPTRDYRETCLANEEPIG